MSCRTIIKYRSVWMGAAMLWILLFHIPMELPGAGLRLIRQLGYGGVDLCLFASGVGCFYSLSKDPDAGRFLGRRLWRLGPVYLIFMLFWLPWQYTKGVVTLPNLLGNLFGIQYLTALHNEFNWYVSAILVLYVLAPYLKGVIDTAGWKGRVLFLGLLLVLTVPFWMSGTYIIIVTRIPIFYLGMLFAAASAEGRSIRPWQLLVAVALAAVGVAALNWGFEHIMNKMWAYGLHWYPHILIAPPVCAAVAAHGSPGAAPRRRADRGASFEDRRILLRDLSAPLSHGGHSVGADPGAGTAGASGTDLDRGPIGPVLRLRSAAKGCEHRDRLDQEKVKSKSCGSTWVRSFFWYPFI